MNSRRWCAVGSADPATRHNLPGCLVHILSAVVTLGQPVSRTQPDSLTRPNPTSSDLTRPNSTRSETIQILCLKLLSLVRKQIPTYVLEMLLRQALSEHTRESLAWLSPSIAFPNFIDLTLSHVKSYMH